MSSPILTFVSIAFPGESICENGIRGVVLVFLLSILVVRRVVVHLVVVKLSIAGLVIVASGGLASIAYFPEGIVEVMAVVADPILVSISARGFCVLLHWQKTFSILFNTLSINFILFSDYEKTIVNVPLLNGCSLFRRFHPCSCVRYLCSEDRRPSISNTDGSIRLITLHARSEGRPNPRGAAALISRCGILSLLSASSPS